MRKFKLPVTSGNLVGLINDMRTGAASKLSAFCSQQILEKRLSTKTFKYDFDIAGRRSGGQRKSVQKLREILLKHVKKQITYLEYVKSGDTFLAVHSSRSNEVNFKLESPYIKIQLTDTHYEPVGILVDHPWFKGVHRYARFLNFKAIRSGTPLNCQAESLNYLVHPEDAQVFEAWNSVRKTGDVATVRVRATVRFAVKVAFYSYTPFIDGRADDVLTYDQFEKGLSGDALKAFRTVFNWRVTNLAGISTIRADYPGSEKYATAEKIFLVLDDLIKVITTLTRRVQYDTAAFNIGSAEAS